MSDENDEPEEEPEEQAEWLATFADLMSLLMCFFVLLLSFSEMDIQKYKAIAGSMAAAFGVQRDIIEPDLPTATSIIAREYSPGMPVPVPIHIKQIRKSFEDLKKSLRKEIRDGQVQIHMVNDEIVVRIQESESFTSGSADLRPTLYPILDSIIESVKETTGKLIVGGHTDNVPIATRVYKSNWVLSSARAANVVHHLATTNKFDPKQIEIRAYGDTRPLRSNDTADDRAVNRRVEIIVTPGSILDRDYGNESAAQTPADENAATSVGPVRPGEADEAMAETGTDEVAQELPVIPGVGEIIPGLPTATGVVNEANTTGDSTDPTATDIPLPATDNPQGAAADDVTVGPRND